MGRKGLERLLHARAKAPASSPGTGSERSNRLTANPFLRMDWPATAIWPTPRARRRGCRSASLSRWRLGTQLRRLPYAADRGRGQGLSHRRRTGARRHGRALGRSRYSGGESSRGHGVLFVNSPRPFSEAATIRKKKRSCAPKSISGMRATTPSPRRACPKTGPGAPDASTPSA